jgi:hypothetical protein
MSRYEVRVGSRSALDWSDWFCELQVRTATAEGEQPSTAVLTGTLPDQSALLGVLMRLHNLNLIILSVQRFEEEE